MRFLHERIFGMTTLIIIVLLSGFVMANEPPQKDPVLPAGNPSVEKEPDITDIIPLSGKLAGRLTVLKNQIPTLPEPSVTEKKYDEIDPELKKLSGQLEVIKESTENRFSKLEKLRDQIKHQDEIFTISSTHLNQSISQVTIWKKEWVKEKNQWQYWQTALEKEDAPDQLKSAFKNANATIDTALNLIRSTMGKMMSVQEKAAAIQQQFIEINSEIDALIAVNKLGALINASPPMVSSEYFSQLSSGLWFAVKQGTNKIQWTDSRFFAYQGWALFTQVFLSLMLGILFYRKKKELDELEHWRFLASRPFAAGIFLVSMVTMITLSYYGLSAIWRTVNIIVAVISFRLISETLIAVSWRRQLVFGLMIIIVISRILNIIDFPLPLVRLVTLIEAMAGFLFCLRWAKESIENKEPAFYSTLMRSGAFFFVTIIIADIFGVQVLPLYLLLSVMNSIAIALVLMLFLYCIHGGVQWLSRKYPFSQSGFLDKEEIDSIIARTTRIIDFTIWGLIFLPATLKVWGVFDTLEDAIKWMLSIGFQTGTQRLTLGLLLVSAGILYLSFLFSWIIQKMLMHIVLVKKVAEQGIRYSITRLIHYIIVFIGFLIAISVIGLDVTKLTIMISALGVGIGFGMQGIVNNFISGLILLFERPIRVGDTIEINGKWSEIKRIGLRATTVQTYEQADVIIPNADLIANNVINWTLTNRLIRASIPVGVAYGSDVALVMKTLIASAASNTKVAQRTPPQVFFRSFGASSLDFELRVWVIDADYRLQVVSELNQEIDRRFREANIEISFPQRDLHLRSVDESIKLGLNRVVPKIENPKAEERPTGTEELPIVS